MDTEPPSTGLLAERCTLQRTDASSWDAFPMHPAAALPRSYLYVPADREDRLQRCHDRGADAVIADLEDGVAADRKDVASAALAPWLDDVAGTHPDAVTWVRLDPVRWETDLLVVVHPAVAGVVVPKAEEIGWFTRLDRALRELESERDVAPLGVIPLVESARGLANVDAVAAAPRVERLGMGEADLSGELGLQPDELGTQLAPARWDVVTASARAGIAAPVASTSTEFRDLSGLADTTVHLRRLGFRARTAIHPAQLEAINRVFTPDATELAEARALVAAAEASGGGAITGPDGRMLDEAVVRSARDVLARSRS